MVQVDLERQAARRHVDGTGKHFRHVMVIGEEGGKFKVQSWNRGTWLSDQEPRKRALTRPSATFSLRGEGNQHEERGGGCEFWASACGPSTGGARLHGEGGLDLVRLEKMWFEEACGGLWRGGCAGAVGQNFGWTGLV